MRRALAVALMAGVLAACGGGSGGGGLPPGFLTADARGMSSGGTTQAAAPGANASDAANGISRAIEEADLYRLDGDRLYLLNSYRGMAVVDLSVPSLSGRLALEGVPQEMFLRGTHAFVLNASYDGGTDLVDVSTANPAALSLLASFPLSGGYRTSRLVGNVLYVLTDVAAYSFSVAAGLVAVDSLTIPGGAEFAHATDAFLFVAASDGLNGFGGTRVTLIDIGDAGGAMALRGSETFPGYVSDEFKLHFGAGTFRIVTHDWQNGQLSHLYVVDVSNPDAPFTRGTLDLAKGDQLFATRFTDTAAYVVTFFQVDPLWVIDLSDPDHPKVAGSLTVPGWSTHLVPLPGRLVALGMDPANGWMTTASLFDVSNPALPSLLSRVDFGQGWSSAFSDVKGFGVFPVEGLVLVPFAGAADRLEVLTLSPSALAARGSIDAEGFVLRGFPHPRGLCVISAEEVAVADPTTLVVTGRVTIAEDVADALRLPGGTLIEAIRRSHGCRVGGVDLPLGFSKMFPYGQSVAVTGWDDLGSAAYVIDFSIAPPAVSARLELGSGAFPWETGNGWGGVKPMGMTNGSPGMPGGGMMYPIGGYYASDGVVTSDGRLALHGLPPGTPDLTFGTGSPEDGFVVIDIPSAQVETSIVVDGAFVTGFTADGGNLAFTYGRFVGDDRLGRPMLFHEFVRVALATRAATVPTNIPGYVVSTNGLTVYSVEETWGLDWSYSAAVVASDLSTVVGGAATPLDRLPLPSGAYDYRAAGATLFFTTYGAFVMDPVLNGVPGIPFAPSSEIRTVHLGATLSFGPTITYDADFANLLLAEDGSALIVVNGVSLARWDVTGPSATLDWTASLGAWPESARPDAALPGSYLLALGFGGSAQVP